MKLVDNLKIFLKRILKKESVRKLNTPSNENSSANIEKNTNSFSDSLKGNVNVEGSIKKAKGAEIETLICPGDGLGIKH